MEFVSGRPPTLETMLAAKFTVEDDPPQKPQPKRTGAIHGEVSPQG